MRGLVLLCLVATACTEDVGDGPNFASAGGSSPTSASASGSSSSGAGATGDTTSGGGTSTAGATTGASGSTGGTSDDPTGATSTTGSETSAVSGASESTSGGSGPSGGGTPLDPDLDVPSEGESCMFPGSLNECPGVATVCRFYTAEEGRCESCDNCGNLNAACTTGTDCDILFSCYAGRCTNFCQLGTPSCGPVENCLDIGHPTHGVCDPFA
jgi:hypothetical protein